MLLRRAWLVITIALAIAYLPAIRAPYEFDDISSIPGNSTIRTLWPVLSPPENTSVAGRPVVNYSLAINSALNRWLHVDERPYPDGPNKTIGYHIVNLLVHLLCGMLLFGVVRRTIANSAQASALIRTPEQFAAVVTAVWLLHPIQSEAVNYLIQRTELLVSLCYLGVLYTSIRAWDAPSLQSRIVWRVLAVLTCALGMGSKEVMITAPLAIMLYDRAFRAPSWRDAVSSAGRNVFYAALIVTTLISLASITTNARFDTVGFHLGVTWYQYLYSQAWAIAHYLRLALWPDQLTFDYGHKPITGFRGVAGALVLTAALVATVVAWMRASTWGWLAFLGSLFFLLLAPSSSVVPVATEIAAERRVYLALAPALVLVFIGADWLRQRITANARAKQLALAAPVLVGLLYVVLSGWFITQHAGDAGVGPAVARGIIGVAAGAIVWCVITSHYLRAITAGACTLLVAVTFARSRTYADSESLWRDTVLKAPDNPRAYDNLAATMFYSEPPRLAEAKALYERAIQLDSTYVHAWPGLASVAVDQGRIADAESLLVRVLRIDPGYSDAVEHLGKLLLRTGQSAKALPYLEQFAVGYPSDGSLISVATAYMQLGRFDDAIDALRKALELNPERTDAMRYLGGMLVEQGHGAEAVPLLERAVSGGNGAAVDLGLLSIAYAHAGRVDDAVRLAQSASASARGSANVQILAGRAMLVAMRPADAAAYFTEALRLNPGNSEAQDNMDKVRAMIGVHP